LRVCKILGGDIQDSKVVKGFVINRVLETSSIELIENAKVAVYKCPF
jgi:chaperonin GroEL (HSP60 family)